MVIGGPNGRLDLPDVTELELAGGYGAAERRTARSAGMYAWDIRYIHNYCFDQRLILVFRTNKFISRGHMLRFDADPKPRTVKEKTRHGIAVADGHRYYSDYDLMSIWRDDGKKLNSNILNKRFNNNGIKYDREFFNDVNDNFCVFGEHNRIQHGGNDDYYDLKSGCFLGEKNVKSDDDFLVCGVGATPFIKSSMASLHRWYRSRGFSSDLEMQTHDGRRFQLEIWPYNRG